MSDPSSNFTVSIAPMMDWTDRHCRWFHRQLTSRARLYTEMVVADAIIHGPKDRLLGFHDIEHPVALQIGGSDPTKLAKAAKIGAGYGYDEININIGCPSDRVQSGRFGACLMAEPELVAECFSTMQTAVDIPVTVKCRLGINDQNLDETLPRFIETVSKAGCTHFIVHARKAWLKGLSPKENRTVPPIQYELVQTMKAKFPQLDICVNGQLDDLTAAMKLCEQGDLDGFMLGRAAYHNPWMLTNIDTEIFGVKPQLMSREAVADLLIGYCENIESEDRTTKALIRHIMGLYAGQAGARHWRRNLSEGLSSGAKPSEVIRNAARQMHQFEVAA